MKRILALLVASMLCVTVLTGCNSDKSGKFSGKTVEEGKLVMATAASLPPYAMTGDKDRFEGIDVEIAQAIADKLGLELQVKDMSYSALITAVQTGEADMAMGALAVTEERKNNIRFTRSYASGEHVVVAIKDSPVCKSGILPVGKISAAEGSVAFTGCVNKCGTDRVVACKDEAEAVRQLTDGTVVCAMVSNETAQKFCDANKTLILCENTFDFETKDKDGKAEKHSVSALVNKKEYAAVSIVLNGYLIGTQEGTVSAAVAEREYGAERVVGYSNGATAMQALLTGNVDCAILDNESAKMYCRANNQLTVLPADYGEMNYAIGVGKNNEKLFDRVDGALEELIKDGTVQKIVEKYIPEQAAATATATAA